MPEGHYPLSQAVTYLATAPKSNASGAAYQAAREDVLKSPDEPVPLHLRNAATALMKDLGYGKGYQYAHDQPGGKVTHGHRPPSVEGRVYYRPTDRGYEITIRKLMEKREPPALQSPP
jgi:putative ATPase